MNEEQISLDHRPRVAAERRERTRARLIESAMLVFADRGMGANVIQEVIAAAGVSQGTFYNYFRSNEELLEAVAQQLNDELIQLIETEVDSYKDPVRRVASGVRMFMHAARAYPLLARFICVAGLRSAGPGSLLHVHLPVDIEQGLALGRFKGVSVEVAVDIVAGTTLTTILRMATSDTPSSQPEQAVTAILHGLGIPLAQARTLVRAPLAPINAPPSSLLERGRTKVPAERETKK
ncbi:TetR/AcrR family transcriptional regulator [Paraburkholderia sp. J12]|uniref:TetR/AcrR family transcriptional regulator n=1 Tax=Paraburkholderia sp. J12 TaxID=2805432 RepID=UPI002ABDC7E6|nr:TetR/AcrR family transcriptional regulator [Paraburkholderia sp. J12]